MRWTRILKYAVVLHVTTFVVGFLFGLLQGFIEGASGAPLAGDLLLAMDLTLTLAIFATISAVLGLMAYRTAGWPVLGAVHLVALTVWLTSLPLNVVLLGQPVLAWVLQGLFMEFCLLCGLGAGVGLRALICLLTEPGDEPEVLPATTEPVGARA